MRILVTGASGFVAEHLLPELEGHHVTGVDRNDEASGPCDEFISFDLVADDFAKLPSDFDLVIHMAAARADWGVDDEEFMRDNFVATQNLLNYILHSECRKLVFVSTVAVYEKDKSRFKPVTEQAEEAPYNAYGKSKHLAEQFIIQKCRENPTLCVNIIRPVVIYGPSNPSNTGIYRAVDNNIFRLIDGIYNDRFAIIGTGTSRKSIAYVKNFADAVIFLSDPVEGYEITHYSDDPTYDMHTLCSKVNSLLGKPKRLRRLNKSLILPIVYILDLISSVTKINFPISRSRIETFMSNTDFDAQKIRKGGYTQRYSNDTALSDTVAWYLDLRMTEKQNFFFFKKSKR